MFSHQYNYAPSADTLSLDIRDEIQHTFPSLHQDVINDAVDFGRQQYVHYTDTGSDQEAKDFFLNAVTNYILNTLKEQYDTIYTFMLLRERDYQTETPLTSSKAQDLTSAFMKLPSRPLERLADTIADRRRPPRFPKQYNVVSGYPDFLSRDSVRINRFSTLRNKLQQQLKVAEILARVWTPYSRDILIQIFDAVYDLQFSGLHSIQLERSIIDAVHLILRNTNNLSSKQKADFMLHFSNTINNEENIIYCKNKRKEF